jgi:hypothetical protein
MNLRHLSIPELIVAAGGDPWKLDETIQSGSPGEINELATAFYNAGVCIGDTSDEFNQAKKRFEDAWDRNDGAGHPINDSEEVQRATESLHLDKEEIARIAVDLETISASLAEAQQTSSAAIRVLGGNLQQIDDAIEAAIVQNGLTVDENDLAPLKNMAVQEVREALQAVGVARDSYGGELSRAMASLQAEGYTPDAIDGVDGNNVNASDVARNEAAEYDAKQRAADQALMDSGGPMTPEKEAAAARLRDYATIQDPSADPTAIRLAGERLDDFQTAQQPPGTLPRDPILGADPQRRALVRQEWQKQLEQGSPWMPPMTPDEATSWMDQQEAAARGEAIDRTVKALENQGMSREEATSIVDAASQGATWSDLAYGADVAGPLSELKLVDGALSDGRHSLPWETYSPEALKTVSNIGKVLGGAGSLLEVGVAVNEWREGAPPGATFGGLAGSLGGGAGGGAALGFIGGWTLGPGGAFVGAVVGGLAGSALGKQGGTALGGVLDN